MAAELVEGGAPRAAAAGARAAERLVSTADLRVPAEDARVVLLDSPRNHISVVELAGVGRAVMKRFKVCDGSRQRFEAERRHLAALSASCDNVLCPLGTVDQAPTYALLLPFCQTWGSLDKVVHGAAGPLLSAAWRLCLAADCAAGVAAAHRAGVVLCDVKPANVLVGEDRVGRLSDLELAAPLHELRGPPPKHTGGPASRPRRRFEGTPQYVAPELISAYNLFPQQWYAQRRACSFASDVFALGVSLNEVLSGRVPYTDVERTDAQLHTVVETGYTPLALCEAVAERGLRPTPLAGPLGQLAARMLLHEPGERAPWPSSPRTLRAWAPRWSAAPRAGRPCRPSRRECRQEELRRLTDGVSPAAAGGGRLRFCAGGGEGAKGRRELMEDAFSVREWAEADAACYVVADGHGGAACARFVCDHLPAAMTSSCLACPGAGGGAGAEVAPLGAEGVSAALREAFRSVEAAWAAGAAASGDTSGACVVAALVLGDLLWVAHCGDCRAVLDRGGDDAAAAAAALTADHVITADMAQDGAEHPETARVLASGGRFLLTPDGRLRVGAAGTGGGLQVTRSFGDAARYTGVVCEPDVCCTRLAEQDCTLILATDGVWDVLEPATAVEKVRSTVRHKDYGAKRLVGEALDAGSKDNTCAIVVYLSEVDYSIARTSYA